jgi:hypothetical protein
MGKRGFKPKMLFLAMALIVLSNAVHGDVHDRKYSLKIEQKLKFLNRHVVHAVKTIQSEDGDIIDCVPKDKQPSLDHPALKNHTIQSKPSHNISQFKEVHSPYPSQMENSQIWNKKGSCPKGTVPIRRIRKEDLWRAPSLERFGRKNPQIMYNGSIFNMSKDGLPSSWGQVSPNWFGCKGRSAAILITLGSDYIGASAAINIWSPYVELPEDFTSGQIWLKNGRNNIFESLETGWIVHPRLYGDTRPRLFVYWTLDSSQMTGCFDLFCPGFIQTSKKVVVGGAFNHASTKWGLQYHMPISISRDPSTGNWWLTCGNEVVGYWPGDLFTALRPHAAVVEWGGEVFSSHVKTNGEYHTATHMASGEFANATNRFGVTNFIRNVRIVDKYSLLVKYPDWVNTWSDEGACYSTYNERPGDATGPIMYFGGPGRNFPDCH